MNNENELFEQWYFANFYNQNDPYHKRGFENAWQACAAIKNKRIAELEEKIKRKEIADKSYALAITTAMIEKDTGINELKADNERLREFLRWECDVLLNGQDAEWSKKYQLLLQQTTAQSKE